MPLQFEVIVAEHQSPLVTTMLKERSIRFHKFFAGLSFIIRFRVPDGHGNWMIAELEDVGVGRTFGILNVYKMETSKPLSIAGFEQIKLSSVHEKQSVERILQNVKAGAALSFDVVMLLIAASIISAAGLASNSSVVVVASMLVSPLMGPIMGFTFGTIMHEWKMVWQSLLIELLMLMICVTLGFITCLIFLPFGEDLDFPTDEMSSRGEPKVLLFGMMIAAPSGVGVALSLTGGNFNSLVGVAISASLLPPAVNAGMLISYGLFGPLVHGDDVDRVDYMELGGISFALVIVNIACIYIMGILTFYIKAIAPLRTSSVDYYKEYQLEHELVDTYSFQLDEQAQATLERLQADDDSE